MPVFENTYFAKGFTLTQASNGLALPITGWTFESNIRVNATAPVALLDLTTGNGGIVVTDGPNGRLEMRLTAAQTAMLPIGSVVFDVIRTDAVPGPIWMFGGSMRVRQPITRP